jgi:hypothetical protein
VRSAPRTFVRAGRALRARRDARRRAAKRSPLLAKDTTRATAQRVR